MHSPNAPHLSQLQHQAVRDLAWCCFSAPMMRALPGSEASIFSAADESLWPWLFALDQQPQPLLNHLAQLKSTRLGIYYEALWNFYFNQHPGWELLQHNLQIDRNGATLGAFDFLCRRDGSYWHIETAVKFYLCRTLDDVEAREWHSWIGPEGKDRLDIKLDHLRRHQLPLHHLDEATHSLKENYPKARTWNTALCLQGYLFSPARRDMHPEFSHPEHGKGHWWFARELLEQLAEGMDLQWKILERHQWLSPARANVQEDLLSSQEFTGKIKTAFATDKRPLLAAAMEPVVAPMGGEYWAETARVFVVPDGWPG